MSREPAILKGARDATPTSIIRPMRGLHLTADLRGCAAGLLVMTEPSALRIACLAAVAKAGLTPVGELFHRFDPAPQTRGSTAGGVTGVVLLAESHLAVHTWPRSRRRRSTSTSATSAPTTRRAAEIVLAVLVEAFSPASTERHAVERGALAAVQT